MGFPNIVCPNNKSLLRKFKGRSVALRLNDMDGIAEGVANVRDSGNTLFCVTIEANRPLAEIGWEDCPEGTPLAIMAPSMGLYRNLRKHLEKLRGLDLRIYLPCDNADNLTSLRILSSVGIHTCADFKERDPDWESLADLAAYAILGQTPHAGIEPFAHILVNYDPSQYLDWGRVVFDDPARFLHLDEDGRVALSRAELDRNRFVGNLNEIEAPEEFPPIRERNLSWRNYFINNHPCASCAGWKVCLGKFSGSIRDNAGCSRFFTEMLDLVCRRRSLDAAREEHRVWQP